MKSPDLPFFGTRSTFVRHRFPKLSFEQLYFRLTIKGVQIMKAYIMSIIGATLLAAMAGIMAPEKWRGYVQVVTGLVIISCIIAPVSSVVRSDIFSGFESVEENISDGEELQSELVKKQLKERIDADLAARIKKEYGLNISSDCSIRVNEEGEIEGVESVHIYGDKLTDRAKNRICEVYGLKPYEVVYE